VESAVVSACTALTATLATLAVVSYTWLKTLQERLLQIQQINAAQLEAYQESPVSGILDAVRPWLEPLLLALLVL
jgi:hypothetical protein